MYLRSGVRMAWVSLAFVTTACEKRTTGAVEPCDDPAAASQPPCYTNEFAEPAYHAVVEGSVLTELGQKFESVTVGGARSASSPSDRNLFILGSSATQINAPGAYRIRVTTPDK